MTLTEPTMPDRAHRVGCPATRVESYPLNAEDGREVTVTRCCDCGEHLVFEKEEQDHG